MKLLFVFTGGTIGSTKNNNVLSVKDRKAYKIIDAYDSVYGIDFEYDIAEPYNELSENNTGWHIRRLVESVTQKLKTGYDGIVITHGSDSLQYSAAALGYCVGSDSIPICIVASNAPIEDEASNALDNLRGAITFIKGKCGRGVFAVYRNSDECTVKVHRATRLIGSKAYSDELSSLFGITYGAFNDRFEFVKNEEYHEREDEMRPFDISRLSEESNEILMLGAYTGMIYPDIPQGVKYILLNTYHSGTLNVKSKQTERFLKTARERGVKVFATGVSHGAQYESAEQYAVLGIESIKALSPISAYVKLWLGSVDGKEPRELFDFSLGGDII